MAGFGVFVPKLPIGTECEISLQIYGIVRVVTLLEVDKLHQAKPYAS